MSLKINAKDWTIKEQILKDEASGLTLQFEVSKSGECKLSIFDTSKDGEEILQFGNRDLFFMNGEESGAGTNLTGHARATWIKEVSSNDRLDSTDEA